MEIYFKRRKKFKLNLLDPNRTIYIRALLKKIYYSDSKCFVRGVIWNFTELSVAILRHGILKKQRQLQLVQRLLPQQLQQQLLLHQQQPRLRRRLQQQNDCRIIHVL